MVPHPGNDSGFGTLLNRDSLGPGNRSAANRRGMIGNRTGQPGGEISMCRMEGQKCEYGTVEVFDVFGLGFISASGVGLFAFGIPLGGSLGFEFGTDLVDSGNASWCNPTANVARFKR